LRAQAHAVSPRRGAAQAVTNGGGTPFNVPFTVTISSAAYTGQQSAWNWQATYQGSGTVSGALSQVRMSATRRGASAAALAFR